MKAYTEKQKFYYYFCFLGEETRPQITEVAEAHSDPEIRTPPQPSLSCATT